MLREAKKDLKGLDFVQLALRKGFTVHASKSLCPCHERLQHKKKKKKERSILTMPGTLSKLTLHLAKLKSKLYNR